MQHYTCFETVRIMIIPKLEMYLLKRYEVVRNFDFLYDFCFSFISFFMAALRDFHHVSPIWTRLNSVKLIVSLSSLNSFFPLYFLNAENGGQSILSNNSHRALCLPARCDAVWGERGYNPFPLMYAPSVDSLWGNIWSLTLQGHANLVATTG